MALGAAATLRQIRVNREGNTIGLFAKAIDQMASEDLSFRQGGIYAMELLSGLDPAYRGYLSGADLTGAALDGADLTGAVWDDTTRWPSGFRPP